MDRKLSKLEKLEPQNIIVELYSDVFLYIPFKNHIGEIYTTSDRLNDIKIILNNKEYSLLYLLKCNKKIRKIQIAAKHFVNNPTLHTKDKIRTMIVCDAELSYSHIAYCLIKSVYLLSDILSIKCDGNIDEYCKNVMNKINVN